MLLMPAWDDAAAGVKLVTVHPPNSSRGLPLINGVYVLFSGETLEPIACFEAAALTALRTAAVSAVATKHLAGPAAGRLVVFGSGVQADSHVRALAAVRTLEEVILVPHRPGGADELVARLTAEGIPARPGTAGDVAGSDLVCTCTTSPTPVLEGGLLRPGTHVNAVGSHTPQAREVDTATVERAFVVVETREAAGAEAGDLLIPLAEGAVVPVRVPGAELGEVVRGVAPDDRWGDITLFKSVGVAFEDLALARFAYERIRAAGPRND